MSLQTITRLLQAVDELSASSPDDGADAGEVFHHISKPPEDVETWQAVKTSMTRGWLTSHPFWDKYQRPLGRPMRLVLTERGRKALQQPAA